MNIPLGKELKNINQLGVTTEYRDGSKYEWTKAVSFCYVAEPARDIGTKYMGDEIEEGFEPVWKTLDEAIAIFEKEDTELRMMLTGVIAALLRGDET